MARPRNVPLPRPRFVERRMTRFLREPPSVRGAAGTIVSATAIVVVLGGALMRLLDRSEYPDVWRGMWWALQTVTTVGYGDVTPKHISGRIVASFLMLEGIAFLAIVTAAITSTFVARATEEHLEAEAEDEESDYDKLSARLDELNGKLDRLAASLGGPRDG
jgi:voltage-gated potassium channel Kch